MSGEYRDTLIYDEKILLQHSISWHGIWNEDEHSSEDLVLSYNIKYHRGQRGKRAFFAQFNTIWSSNLTSNEQIVLGGATGVRGFDNRFQAGDRRVVLTLEERQYTDYHVLNLAYLGFAIFVDIGRAWDPDVDDGLKNKMLADVGFGLRLASSKADAGRVIHLDFAFPLTNRSEPDVDSYQVVIKVKNTL
jgi:hemolysin activation/secretion protein